MTTEGAASRRVEAPGDGERPDDHVDIDSALRAAWTSELDEMERDVLRLVVATGVTRVDALEAMVPDRAGVVADLGRLPLVEVDAVRIVADERWSNVVDTRPDRVGELTADLVQMLIAEPADERDLVEAGRLVLAVDDPDGLRSVIRVVLSRYPPRVGAHHVRTWGDADVLPLDDPHRDWLEGVGAALRGADPAHAVARLATARAAFAEIGDHVAEIDVGLALGVTARRADDFTTLAGLIARCHEAEAAGVAMATYIRLLGEALLHQMNGDPAAALDTLDRIPSDAFEGDWAAQVLMVRGTNLLLCGRHLEAIAQLEAATGVGDAWSHATALALLGTARWGHGDRYAAVEDLTEAERRSRQVGSAAASDLAAATRAAMLAAMHDPRADQALAAVAARAHLDDEGRRLIQVARAMSAANAGNVALTRTLAAPIDVPERLTLSAIWTVALRTAVDLDHDDGWAAMLEQHEALQPAVQAGAAAAAHLAGGERAATQFAPYLPVAWFEPGADHVELSLLGAASARRGDQLIEHSSWERTRVRELCLHLALVDDASRELAAAHLWPDLSSDAAARNLRVTLSHLLDVVDPDRPRGRGSDLIEDHSGVLRFEDVDRLRIDLRRATIAAREIMTADAGGDDRGLLAAARRLRREPLGRLLGGASVGEWVEPYLRHWTDLMAGAVATAAPVALKAGDPALAEELVQRGLQLDPWAERLHQMLVRARLAKDDLDGARRAWRVAVDHLDDLGVRPEAATLTLGRDLGLR